MPVTPSYPGVYIEEIPSGVRTITGVATSITAFVGLAFKGPTNEPVRIQNFGDFERVFGGLTFDSTMSYAVQQFFLNGGSDAIVVRLANSGVKASAALGAGSDKLELEAADVGGEGNNLAVAVNVG
jgi:phage tail sheath protein FI